MVDPYVDGSGVLVNLLGCATPQELTRSEGRHAALRDAELVAEPMPGKFDLQHLQRIHRHLFGDVYAWAGQLRTVNISKGVPFAACEFIESEARKVFTKLAAKQHLRGLDMEPFADAAAQLLSDVNALHPFREGNGRAQRAFLRQLGFEAGYDIDWNAVEADENDWCSLRSLIGDDEPMRAMMHRIVRAAT